MSSSVFSLLVSIIPFEPSWSLAILPRMSCHSSILKPPKGLFPRSRIGSFDHSWSLSFLDKDFGKGTAVSRLKPVWGGKATPSFRLKQRPIYSSLLCIQRQPYLRRCNHLPDSCSCADLKLIANISCGGIEIPPGVVPTAGIKRGLMSSDFKQN